MEKEEEKKIRNKNIKNSGINKISKDFENRRIDNKVSLFQNLGEVDSFFDKVKNFFQVDKTTSSPVGPQKPNPTSKKDKEVSSGSDSPNFLTNMNNSTGPSVAQKKDGLKIVDNSIKSEDFLTSIKKWISVKLFERKNWSAPNVLNTNLIKGEYLMDLPWGKYLRILVMNIFLAVFVVALFYGGLLYWENEVRNINKQLDLVVDNQQRVIKDLKKEVLEIDAFNEKVTKVQELLDSHIYWEGFFDFFESNIVEDVYLPDYFEGGVEGEYNFLVRTKDLETMLNQVNYLRSLDNVLLVEVSGVSFIDNNKDKTVTKKSALDNYPVTFQMKIKIDKKIFTKK